MLNLSCTMRMDEQSLRIAMKSPKSVAKLEDLGRVRLSPNFFMRDFLYSEIANLHGLPNIPEDPDLTIAAARGFARNSSNL